MSNFGQNGIATLTRFGKVRDEALAKLLNMTCTFSSLNFFSTSFLTTLLLVFFSPKQALPHTEADSSEFYS